MNRARAAAGQAYAAPGPAPSDLIEGIDYDVYRHLGFDGAYALWRDGGARHPVALFHLHHWVPWPVGIDLMENGQVRRVVYDAGVSDYSGELQPADLPSDLGCAGLDIS